MIVEIKTRKRVPSYIWKNYVRTGKHVYTLTSASEIAIKRAKKWCFWHGAQIRIYELTVDHVIPVIAAKCSAYFRRLLPDGVNDPSNLVASCARCNMHKGQSTA